METRIYCENSRNFRKEVTGSKGDTYIVSYGYTPFGPYQYGWHCTCWAYKKCDKRIKTCKHIEALKKDSLCELDGFNDYLYDYTEDKKCPNCGGGLEVERHAV